MLVPVGEPYSSDDEDQGLYPNPQDCPKELKQKIIKMYWEDGILPKQIHRETNVCLRTIERFHIESSRFYKARSTIGIEGPNPLSYVGKIERNNRIWQDIEITDNTKICEVIEIKKSPSLPSLQLRRTPKARVPVRRVPPPPIGWHEPNTSQSNQTARGERNLVPFNFNRELATNEASGPVYPQLLSIGQETFELEPDVQISKVSKEEVERYEKEHPGPAMILFRKKKSLRSPSSPTHSRLNRLSIASSTQSLDRIRTRKSKKSITDVIAKLHEASLTKRAQSEVTLKLSRSGSMNTVQDEPVDLSLPRAESSELSTSQNTDNNQASGAIPKTRASTGTIPKTRESTGAIPKTRASTGTIPKNRETSSRVRKHNKSDGNDTSDDGILDRVSGSRTPTKMRRRPGRSDLNTDKDHRLSVASTESTLDSSENSLIIDYSLLSTATSVTATDSSENRYYVDYQELTNATSDITLGSNESSFEDSTAPPTSATLNSTSGSEGSSLRYTSLDVISSDGQSREVSSVSYAADNEPSTPDLISEPTESDDHKSLSTQENHLQQSPEINSNQTTVNTEIPDLPSITSDASSNSKISSPRSVHPQSITDSTTSNLKISSIVKDMTTSFSDSVFESAKNLPDAVLQPSSRDDDDDDNDVIKDD